MKPRKAESLAQGHTVVMGRAGIHTLAGHDFRRKGSRGTSLVVQWSRICLAKQGTWVQPLVGELRHTRAVEQPSRSAAAPEPVSHG